MTDRKKKNSSWVWIVVAVVIMSVLSSEDFSEDAFIAIIGIAMFALPIVAIFLVVRMIVSKNKPVSAHSHDRIDHSTDLKIDAKTGRAVHTPVKNGGNHSAREHWKQQMDALLANGTIDRNEYRAMMNRKL